jgi:hypothetical protein
MDFVGNLPYEGVSLEEQVKETCDNLALPSTALQTEYDEIKEKPDDGTFVWTHDFFSTAAHTLIQNIEHVVGDSALVALFGEILMNYHFGFEGPINVLEMLIFFDYNAFYKDRGDDYKTKLEQYKTHMITQITHEFTRFIYEHFSLFGFTSFKLVVSDGQETFHSFTTSTVFEILDQNNNVVLYCEFGKIKSITIFKHRFCYESSNIIIKYYLNEDGFLFTFFLNMKRTKIKKGIAYFEQCISLIKNRNRLHRISQEAFADKLISLFSVDMKNVFNIESIVEILKTNDTKIYIPLYLMIQTEILQELFINFDAEVKYNRTTTLSYKEFVMKLNQDLLKGLDLGQINGNYGNKLSIYQLLVYYTNILHDTFPDAAAQESGGDVLKQLKVCRDMANLLQMPPYLSDLDIKFFFSDTHELTQYEIKIINSLFYLIAYLEENRYLRYSTFQIGTVNVSFGNNKFLFTIDSISQQRIFGIRYAKDWNNLPGLLSADIKLNITFTHINPLLRMDTDHNTVDRRTGQSYEYKGKFVMAFFDIACWKANQTKLESIKPTWASLPVSQSISNVFGAYQHMVSGGSLSVRLMNIPFLYECLNESNELVYIKTHERKMVNKHTKDISRRIDYLELVLEIIKHLKLEDQDVIRLVNAINFEMMNLNFYLTNPETILKPSDFPLWNHEWHQYYFLTNISYLPSEQLVTICKIQQVEFNSRNLIQKKEEFTEGLIAAFRLFSPYRQTRDFLTSMAGSNKAKTSYRGNPVTLTGPVKLTGLVLGGSGGGRHRRKRRGATKKKQKRRIGKTRRRR